MSDTSVIVEFVKSIECYPCLYNHTLSEYSRKDVTEKAWNDIASKMNWTVADCKEKWRNIRNGFVRSLKSPPIGSSAKAKKQYYLHDTIQFVLPFVKPMRRSLNFANIDSIKNQQAMPLRKVEYSNDEPDQTTTPKKRSSSPTDSSMKKIKSETNELNGQFSEYIKQEQGREDYNDHRKMFLLSLLPDVNKLSENNMRLFKIEIMTTIQSYLTSQRFENISFNVKNENIE